MHQIPTTSHLSLLDNPLFQNAITTISKLVYSRAALYPSVESHSSVVSFSTKHQSYQPCTCSIPWSEYIWRKPPPFPYMEATIQIQCNDFQMKSLKIQNPLLTGITRIDSTLNSTVLYRTFSAMI